MKFSEFPQLLSLGEFCVQRAGTMVGVQGGTTCSPIQSGQVLGSLAGAVWGSPELIVHGLVTDMFFLVEYCSSIMFAKGLSKMTKVWKFPELPVAARDRLLLNRVGTNHAAVRSEVANSLSLKQKEKSQSMVMGGGLFGFDEFEEEVVPEIVSELVPLVVGTDLYEGYEVFGNIDAAFLNFVKPRVEKSKVEQVKRTKEKAEVFTPTFLVKAQNDLVDEKMQEMFADDWAGYVDAPVLEITCGEGPYLMSPYDATTGESIPVRDAAGSWCRVGLLDRKLVKVSENCDNFEDWWKFAVRAVRATFGYEWQGDNLVLARLNMVNTVFDYMADWLDSHDMVCSQKMSELVEELTFVVCDQLWQMDGLKNVVPGSCPVSCDACKKKKKFGHEGIVPVFRFGDRLTSIDLMLTHSSM